RSCAGRDSSRRRAYDRRARRRRPRAARPKAASHAAVPAPVDPGATEQPPSLDAPPASCELPFGSPPAAPPPLSLAAMGADVPCPDSLKPLPPRSRPKNGGKHTFGGGGGVSQTVVTVPSGEVLPAQLPTAALGSSPHDHCEGHWLAEEQRTF